MQISRRFVIVTVEKIVHVQVITPQVRLLTYFLFRFFIQHGNDELTQPSAIYM